MNSTFTTKDMKLLIEALIHMYITHKTTYHESRDPWDQGMMEDYRDILLKIEDLTGGKYISPKNRQDTDLAFEKFINGLSDEDEQKELPNNVLDFTKRRKDD